MRSLHTGIFLMAAAFAASGLQAQTPPPAFRPKVVILTTFETGNDTGDEPGEFQFWVEREKLDHTVQVPGLTHPVRYNDAGVFGVVTGTCDRSGLGLMALGLDPRFDLTHTYWLTAAIAGVDAREASVGSAAWARWIVDGDNVNEVDGHDAPHDWPYGILPYGAHRPDEAPGKDDWSEKPMAFELDAGLVDWAFNLTRNVALSDSPEARKFRAAYTDEEAARRLPFVLEGDTLGTARYWHGPALTRWAESWVRLYTGGKGHFVMTECEDQSIAYALHLLGKAGRVDARRYLVLRTASNYSSPPPGETVVESLLTGEHAGTPLALESAYRVGAPVLHELLKGWDRYEHTMPGHSQVAALADDPACDDADRRFMARAYELARQAVAHGNEPFGALLVKDGQIIFENENSIFTSRDLTQHGETGLISKASQKLDTATLAASTLYTSTEPCNMCCGAIRWAGIRRVVYGTTASQMSQVINALLPTPPAAQTQPRLEVREQFARTAPQVIVQGPLMEVEGLAIHESYWPGSTRLKKLSAK